LPEAEQTRLVDLALGYAEARIRFGLVDEALEKRIVTARHRFRQSLPLNYVGEIEFYEAEQFLALAPVVDNLLFGRIAFGVANAEQRVNEVMVETLCALDLEPAINRLGLGHDVGPGGRFLFPPQRAAIALARAVLARPQILVVDGALTAFPQAEARRILEALGRRMADGTLLVSLAQMPAEDEFDEVLSFDGPRLVSHQKRDAAPAMAEAPIENVA
jgi:putative ABC transport system ATP-binding protein